MHENFLHFDKKVVEHLENSITIRIFAPANKQGALAQLVEHRTENPCVPGSIPGGTTYRSDIPHRMSLFCFYTFYFLRL